MLKLHPMYFIIAMFITMLILYFIYPNPFIIVKYPTPEQELSDVYIDDNNICYRYKRKEITL